MDDAIFENIYGETSRQLWAYVCRITANPTAADDIVQETYLRFLRSPPREYTMDEARPYLFKIATNLIYDRFRRSKRGETSDAELESRPIADGAETQQNTEMMQVFSRLKQQERALLWLAYAEGYDHREVAAILKLNSMSVRVLLFRARRKLAELIEGA